MGSGFQRDISNRVLTVCLKKTERTQALSLTLCYKKII